MDRTLSPENQDFLDRLREHYRKNGKAAAAANYIRHLKGFFAWAEASGYGLQSLPPESVETYLASLGHKETTAHVMRTQIKGSLREAHAALGVDLAHLEYQPGKPKAVRDAQKAREREKKAAARQEALVLPFFPIAGAPMSSLPSQESLMSEQTEATGAALGASPTTTYAPPTLAPVAVQGGIQQQQPIVVMMPQQQQQRPIQAQQPQKAAQTAQQNAQRGVTINNHTFTGAFVKVSRTADGSEPFVPPGTETYVHTFPIAQLSTHGDIAAYLQQFVIPGLRLSPAAAQVQFVFHELNDRRQPTGRRDEMVVSVPLSGVGFGVPTAAASVIPLAPVSPTAGFDPATQMLLKRFDEESASAKAKAEKLAEELTKTKDSTTQMVLAQMMQREQDTARRFEEQRFLTMQQATHATSMPFPTPVVEVAPRTDPSIEMFKAIADGQARAAESQARTMEALLVRFATPAPAPAPQKDTMEFMLPFITAMNQQAQQQAQAQQQMLMATMQGNQQFMQALLTRESPEMKLIRDELREVRQHANAPKGDDVEAFAEKLQKMKVVGEMLGGGGGGGGGLIETIVANMDTIGTGIAKVMSAAKPSVNLPTARPQLAQAPVVVQPQLPAAPQSRVEAPQVDIGPVIAHLNAAAEAATAAEPDEQKVIDSVVDMVKEMYTLPEPWPTMGKRVMTALQQVEDEDDLFMVAKHLWVAINQKPDKAAAKAIAAVFYKWFPLVHTNLFGQPKFLAGQTEESFAQLMAESGKGVSDAEGEGTETAEAESESESDADDEDDEGVINAAPVDPASAGVI